MLTKQIRRKVPDVLMSRVKHVEIDVDNYDILSISPREPSWMFGNAYFKFITF